MNNNKPEIAVVEIQRAFNTNQNKLELATKSGHSDSISPFAFDANLERIARTRVEYLLGRLLKHLNTNAEFDLPKFANRMLRDYIAVLRFAHFVQGGSHGLEAQAKYEVAKLMFESTFLFLDAEHKAAMELLDINF